MRLTAESIGLQPQDMPPKVAAVQFQQGEETLSPEAKQGAALAYIFGEQYQDSKALIHQNIEAFRTLLSERKNDGLRQTSQETQAALHLTQGYNIAVLGLLLLSLLLFYALVMRPFHRYAVSLQDLSAHEFVSLQPVGSKETKAFAKAFNLIHQDWEKQKKQLEQERFRFQVAVENTAVVVFEYDLATDVYTAYGNLYPDQQRDASIPMEGVIPAFMQSHITELVEEGSSHLVSHVLSGQSPGKIELRVRVYQSKQPFLWARVTTTPIVDAQQVVTKIIGKITNIESEKAKEFALEEMKSRDSLTGLYNKETGIRLVQEYMKQKSPQEESSAKALAPAPTYQFLGKRILVAEDNELNREIAETILTMHDFEVQTAVNGQETVDNFAQHKTCYYDAILMDACLCWMVWKQPNGSVLWENQTPGPFPLLP